MKRLGVFLGIVFILTWGVEFTLMANGGYSNPYLTLILAGVMLIPAISVILTRLITKEGFKEFGLKPHFKGHIRFYLMGWFGPSLLIILGAICYYLIFPANFDPTMSNLTELYKAKGVDATASMMTTIFIAQFAAGMLLSPVLNIITTLGEEIGWRGYLLPKLMERFSARTSILISGAIWGLWHAPIIAMGHNYGTGYSFFPWGGILAMIVFCLFIGSFFSYLAIRTKSVLPSAMAHGSLNGFVGITAFFTIGETSPFIGPVATGIIGGIGFIIVGTICFVLIGRQQSTEKKDLNPVSEKTQ
ncbi:CPBP family intramembrane glutamic endopeptidase [Acetobacterium tundrae]|uniref:CPBP family intramembrane metalloprotease n=1 Tax=Acetobacterium tundrae TaxID=132932 RepID=A0ABR6WGJ1_9FIRM|nr:type II CAAX endopeptidase family protein [Acetobacterium tundrae]MBC3795615.1 CPBP family intramembrane metalloprotease [Acetobacterium tundrae]